MLTARSAIVSAIRERKLPGSGTEIFNELWDPEAGRFGVQESLHWDYKRDFPFSFSDPYFGGIVRLICAFFNTYGGVIIFGVRDGDRTAGHNSVAVNIERLNAVLRNKLNVPIETLHRRYELTSNTGQQRIDLILIPKRSMGIPPARLVADLPPYKANTIWLRRAHEVVEAKSSDYSMLYGGREGFGIDDDNLSPVQSIALPASPATMREFIGRHDAMDSLWRWLFIEDEPRAFLYGKGGSGKSTLAFEFARIVAETGGNTKTRAGVPLDGVIYLSAKQSALDPKTGQITRFMGCDFTTASEQFRAILELSEWMSGEQIRELSDDQIAQELQALFNVSQQLIVVDDIDTLMTAQIDPGMDQLYRVLSRANPGGKVLYTVRNSPTQSIRNSIEVPGLDAETEYPDFIASCCKQFRQPPPPKPLVGGEMASITERRPLVIENIIALKRTCSTYAEAIGIFKSKEGDEARRYIFVREYDALPQDNRARLLLLALSAFGRPVSTTELGSVLKFASDQLSDALAQTLDMFLQIDNSGSETLYSVGQVTDAFIRQVSANLPQHDALKAAIRYVKSIPLPKYQEISALRFRVREFTKRGDYRGAYEFLKNRTLPAQISEHPEFKMLVAQTACKLSPPKYEEAREAFRIAVKNPAVDIQAVRDWYYMELNSGFNIHYAIEACDQVINSKHSSIVERSEFYSKKANVLHRLAESTIAADFELGIRRGYEALNAQLAALELAQQAKLDCTKCAGWASGCFSFVAGAVINGERVGRPGEFSGLCDYLFKIARETEIEFDFLVDNLDRLARTFFQLATRDTANKVRGALTKFKACFDPKSGLKFESQTVRKSLLESTTSYIKSLERTEDLPIRRAPGRK